MYAFPAVWQCAITGLAVTSKAARQINCIARHVMSSPKMNENIKKGHAMWACPFCSTARSRPGRYLSPSRIRSVQLPSLLRLAVQLQDVHPIANAVHDDDDAAVVDFNVVGHVGVVGSGRYIERRLLGSLRVADVPRAHTGVEVSSERQLAIVRIAEVLFARMGAEALAAQAVVAARVFFTRLRIDPQRR